MQISPRYRALYQRALTIRDNSQSLRIRQKPFRVCLGVTDPTVTEYVFVGLNPGGDDTREQSLPTTELTMSDYVKEPPHYQRRVGEVICAFAKKGNLSTEDALPLFGAVNFGFYHSRSAPATLWLEVAECREILLEELALPKLKVLILTGRLCPDLFYLTLWKVGTEVRELDTSACGLHDADPKARIVATTLVTGSPAICVFTLHLSPYGVPLPPGFTAKLGAALFRMTA